ncbi:MAG TPA: D-amino acid aminotransferase [Desulfobacteraceae bacterium]|nr:D-amino acid aminotransferase [Deltaproteobacteria bacterium]RLB93312.1 MAG: D-amino acid aminotransferase [Deltaproteobacteria bacterium]HDI60548.1 D-amino acid aminotransferase [Desulfobacteraceae bacterium]
MPELAYLNGKIMPIAQAMVPAEDRGYNFGDAVYEYVASYHGKLFCLEPHLDRLERSMGELNFAPLPKEAVRRAILELFEKAQIERAGIYVQVSRGVAPRDHAYPPAGTPLQFFMTIRPVREKPPEVREKGASAITVTDLRWGRCDIKTVQLLPNCMAKQQALEAGAFDAIFVSAEGVVREGTSSNLFIAKDGVLVTHPLNHQILPGITRQVIMDICRDEGIEVQERFYHRDELAAADEAFLTGTVTEVLPLVRIDGQAVSDGAVGPLARRLYRCLLERIQGLA